MGLQEQGHTPATATNAGRDPVERILTQTLTLLSSDDRELSCAAARVLGALKPQDQAVVAALAASLRKEDPRLRRVALDAIAAIGGTDAFDSVVPLLGEAGEIGRHAADAITAMGSGVLSKLKRRFDGGSPLVRRRILVVATHLGGADGVGIILKALESGHAQQVLELGERLAEELSQTKGRDRTRLVSEIEKFLQSSGAKLAPDAAGAAVDLLARVLGREASATLIGHAAGKGALAVRRRALEALARETANVPLEPEQVTRLLGLLHDRDYSNVVAPAMTVLERVKLTASNGPALFSLLEGSDPALRRFAVNALGQLDIPKSAEALLKVLAGDNPDLQKRAALALAKLSAAVAPAVQALASASDAQTAWVLARILLPRAHHLKPEQVAALAKVAAKWLEPGDPRAEAMVSVLKERYLVALGEAGASRIPRLKRDRKAGEILNLLRPVQRDDEETPLAVRYEIALAEIVRGPKVALREARIKHPGLAALEKLFAIADFDLPRRLRKDKKYLNPEDYYLIGCHFAERPFADRIFGGDTLRWLVKTFPEDPASTAAANKLLMEGFAPPPPPKAKRAKRAKARPQPKAKAVPSSPPKPQPKAAAKAGSKPGTKAGSKSAPKSSTKPAPKARSKATPKAAPAPKPKPKVKPPPPRRKKLHK